MPHEPMDADDLLRQFGPGALDPDAGAPDAGGPALDADDDLEAAVAALREIAEGLHDPEGTPQSRGKAWSAFLRTPDIQERLATVLRVAPQDVDPWLDLAESAQGMTKKVERLRSRLNSIIDKRRKAEDAERRKNIREAAPDEEGPGLGADLGFGEEVPGGLYCPAGWQVSRAGVCRLIPSPDADSAPTARPVAFAPLLVTRRFVDLDSKKEMLELGWPRDGGWKSQVLHRGDAMDSRALVQVAHDGAPIHSRNAGEIVEYVAAFEAANLGRLPLGWSSQRMGWLGKGGRYFLAGTSLLHGSAAEPEHDVRFLGEGGTEQLAEAVRPGGSFKGWMAAAQLVDRYPVAYLGIYVGAASPLLYLVECPNFIVDISGRSGRGKTTMLRLIASVWGYPEEGSGYIRSWAGTLTGIERTATALNYLPTILDESNKVPERERGDIAKLVYMLANGSGRLRGAAAGQSLQRVSEWRTVAASTGESKLVEVSQDEGTRARTICITAPPLAGSNAALAERLRRELLEHHGHLGPAMVRWLLTHRKAWPDLRQHYRDAVERWGKQASNDMARRMAQYVALLDLTAHVLHDRMGMPRPPVEGVLDVAWEAVEAGSAVADRATAALRLAYDWASSSPGSFWGRTGARADPPGGWRGSWSKDSNWDRLGFFEDQLVLLLQRNGHEPDGILTQWKERGWLMISGKKGRKKREPVGNERPPLVVVKRMAFEAVGAIGLDDDDAS